MTSGTSSPTPTDSPSLSHRPLLLTTVRQLKKTVEFEPECSKKMLLDECNDSKRDPERYVYFLLSWTHAKSTSYL